MEEYQYHQGGDQHGGPPAGPQGRGGYGPDHVRDGPSGPRHALCHRLDEAPAGAGLGT